MNISMGILACNEVDHITKMLDSLVQQTLFTQPDPTVNIEIHVIPNGCTDQTANVATTILKDLIQPDIHPNIRWSVCELQEAGKANAWNHFVHECSNPQADYLFLMDADIVLLDPKTLESMTHLLETQKNVQVAVDKPVKDITFKAHKNLLEKLSLAVSTISGNKTAAGKPSWICGQLYCARSEALRRIYLPLHVQMEDSFIYKMIVTDGLKTPNNPNRVIKAPSASHTFEAYTNIISLLRHQKWLIWGETVNELIYDDLLANSAPEEDISLIIKARNEQNPDWIYQAIQTATQTHKNSWLIPKYILIRRFVGLLHKPALKAMIFLPLSVVTFLIDMGLSILVNLDLNRKYRSL